MPKVTLTCHPEAQTKDLANEKEILRFAQNDSFAVTLGTFSFILTVANLAAQDLFLIFCLDTYLAFRKSSL